MQIKLWLSQMGAAKPGADFSCFHQDSTTADSMADALQWLADRYGITPPKRLHEGNTVFVDGKDGAAEAVGFLAHRWNKDCSHGGKAWWEQNWVTFATVETGNIPDIAQVLKEAA